MAKVFKRGDRWYYRFYRDGKTHWGSAGPEGTKKMAEDLMAAERKKLTAAGIYGATPERVTFGAYADDLFATEYANVESADRYQGILEMLKVEWKGKRLDEITSDMIDRFKAKREAHRSVRTVIKEMQVIRRLFTKAAARGKILANPAAGVKAPKAPPKRKAWLPTEKYAELIGALPEWLRPLSTFLWATGARRGDALGLLWRDVDMKSGTVVFRDCKNGEDRLQYLNATARALLESLPVPINATMNVFPAPPTKSRRLDGKLTREQEQERTRAAYEVKIGRAWREACAKVGLLATDEQGRGVNRFTMHDTRHQSASDMRRAGCDLWSVQTFLGHKSPAMTQVYAEIQPEDARRASEALDRMAPKTAPKLEQPKSETA